MSFYIKNTPEVAAYFGYTYSGRSCIYIVSDNAEDVFVITESDFNSEKCKHFHSLPEFYFHKELGFLSVPKGMESKQQNEKPDQKEENENMNRKENFPVVGQKVLLLNTENYTLTSFGEGFVGKEVTVVSKFTTPEVNYALPTKMVSVLIDELDGYSGVCACFREDMCHPVRTERQKQIEKIYDLLIDWESLENIAEQLYNTGYLPVKTTNKD